MKFKVTNLGCIKSAEIELGKLTLLSGENNTGKTYLTYALYGFLNGVRQNWSAGLSDTQFTRLRDTGSLRVDLNELVAALPRRINSLCVEYIKALPVVFGTGEAELFKGAVFDLELPQQSLDWSAPFESKIGGEKSSLIFKKEAGSSLLEIAHAGQSEAALPSNSVLNQVIGESIAELILKDILPSPHALTAERSAISVFYRELDSRKAALVEALQNQAAPSPHFDPFELMDRVIGRYSSAIKSNIADAGGQSAISKGRSFISEQHEDILKLFAEIAGGKFKHQEKVGFLFKPKGQKTPLLPLFLASSSARSLFGLALYLGYQARRDDMLMIDEPELNLHPHNQLKMAELIVKLVNAGVRVFVTTHSDYIIKQINIMMMRSQTQSGLTALRPEDVRYYWAESETVKEVEKDMFGFVQTPFDDAIDSANQEQDSLTSKLEIASHA